MAESKINIQHSKILVTGGTGQVGKHLKKYIPNATFIGSADFDLTNAKHVHDLFEWLQPDTVIHLAARVGGIGDNIKYPADYFYKNVVMNTLVLDAALQYNVNRFIGMLSTCVYPDVLPEEFYPMKENCLHLNAPAPTNFEYGIAKRAMACYIDAINRQHGKAWQYLIPGNLYGEHDKFDQRSHYVSALLHKIKKAVDEKADVINLFGSGKPLRQFLYAGDLAATIKRCIDKDLRYNINVCPDEELTINEIANLALQACGAEHLHILWDDTMPDGQYKKTADNSLMKSLMPDFTFTPLFDGLKKTWEKMNAVSGKR